MWQGHFQQRTISFTSAIRPNGAGKSELKAISFILSLNYEALSRTKEDEHWVAKNSQFEENEEEEDPEGDTRQYTWFPIA